MVDALRDPSLAVQITGSELLIQLISVTPFKRIEEDIAACTNLQVKANLYGALLNSFANNNALKEIINLYTRSDDYGKAALLNALSYAQGQNEELAIQFLSSEMLKSKTPVIKTAAALALVAFNLHIGFKDRKSVV